MNKRRFVEFYLTACMRAATGGKVVRLGYINYDIIRQEVVVINFSDGKHQEVAITNIGLTDIMQQVAASIA